MTDIDEARRILSDPLGLMLPNKIGKALLARVDAAGWQPIETAPKNGTALLLATPGKKPDNYTMISVGCWHEKFDNSYDWETNAVQYIGAWTDYTVASWSYEEYTKLEPTHWMPLPPPPAGSPDRRAEAQASGPEGQG